MSDHPLAKPTPVAPPSGIEAEVICDIADRQRRGVAKYGKTVADNPLTLKQWLQHAYEEALDSAVYLKRAMAEISKAVGVPADPLPPGLVRAEDLHKLETRPPRETRVIPVNAPLALYPVGHYHVDDHQRSRHYFGRIEVYQSPQGLVAQVYSPDGPAVATVTGVCAITRR